MFSASDQASLEAGLPHLLACRDMVPVLGLSLEPLVGPIDLQKALICKSGYFANVQQLECCGKVYRKRVGVDWVIVGGESGPHARPCDVDWIRSIVTQCREAGVPCFVKQLGGNPIEPDGSGFVKHVMPRDPKGGDPAEWPEDLRVRELPHGTH
jgi:hypothetical protein